MNGEYIHFKCMENYSFVWQMSMHETVLLLSGYIRITNIKCFIIDLMQIILSYISLFEIFQKASSALNVSQNGDNIFLLHNKKQKYCTAYGNTIIALIQKRNTSVTWVMDVKFTAQSNYGMFIGFGNDMEITERPFQNMCMCDRKWWQGFRLVFTDGMVFIEKCDTGYNRWEGNVNNNNPTNNTVNLKIEYTISFRNTYQPYTIFSVINVTQVNTGQTQSNQTSRNVAFNSTQNAFLTITLTSGISCILKSIFMSDNLEYYSHIAFQYKFDTFQTWSKFITKYNAIYGDEKKSARIIKYQKHLGLRNYIQYLRNDLNKTPTEIQINVAVCLLICDKRDMENDVKLDIPIERSNNIETFHAEVHERFKYFKPTPCKFLQ